MTFVIVFALLIAGLIALLMGQEGAPILGLAPDDFARVTMSSALLVALLASLGTRLRGRAGEAIRALAIWTLLFLGFGALYVYRFEFQDVADRMMAELLPGRAATTPTGEASVARRRDGHYIVDMMANGVQTRFVFDTGASKVVVRAEDANRIGIDTATLSYTVPVSTANGMAMAAEARIATLSVGPIVERNVRALVARPGALRENLLGMSFLERLSSYRVENDRLILRGRAG